MEVEAPRVALMRTGEFVIVRIDEEGELIPLTICDYDREQGQLPSCSRRWALTEQMAL